MAIIRLTSSLYGLLILAVFFITLLFVVNSNKHSPEVGEVESNDLNVITDANISAEQVINKPESPEVISNELEMTSEEILDNLEQGASDINVDLSDVPTDFDESTSKTRLKTFTDYELRFTDEYTDQDWKYAAEELIHNYLQEALPDDAEYDLECKSETCRILNINDFFLMEKMYNSLVKQESGIFDQKFDLRYFGRESTAYILTVKTNQ